jgi:hypothetical protein
MKLIIVVVVLSLYFIPAVKAQESDVNFNIESSAGFISSDHIPFWLISNQFGSIPLDNASLSFVGFAHKDYRSIKTGIFDWGASIEGRANIGNNSNISLIEGYGKIRLGIFEFKGGRMKEVTGLCDTSLSSGAFAVSGNALGIPKVQISIPDFYVLPIFEGMFAFKGNYAHGWVGEVPEIKLDNTIDSLKTYLHQFSIYGRFGKPSWKWKLHGGINHEAFWGSESEYYGDKYTLSDLQDYFYVITGKPYGTNDIPKSKIGNHLGSIDLGLEYEFPFTRLFAYHQFFYDVGALYHLANLRDGLTGISLTNKQFPGFQSFQWKKILLEFFYSKNQAGELWSPYTPSGDENYYNNYQYIDGWSYQGVGLGNPLICTDAYTRKGLPSDPGDFFINNRVVSLHLGFEGTLMEWKIILKESFSLNYGTFGTSEVGHTLGKIRTLPRYGIFPETKQFSSYFETSRAFSNQMNFGFVGAFDAGHLYYNSFGLVLKISKSF